VLHLKTDEPEYNNLNSAFNDDMQTLASLVISAKNNAQNANDLIHDATIDGDLNGGDDEEPINDSFRNSGILSLLGQLQANLAGLESGISALAVQVGFIADAVQDTRFDAPGAEVLHVSYESLYSGVESRKSEVTAVIATVPPPPAN